MTTALDAALLLASQGYPVFPCGRNKRPALRNGHGFHDATTEPDAIRRMFGMAGELVGAPTGAVTGFDVLDLDYRNGASEWETANAHRLPETRIHRTQSGGRHYLFAHAPGVRNTAGKIAPGIDVRGDGGYVVLPPSDGYSIEADAEIAEWPDWLLADVLAQPIAPKANGHATSIEISSKRIDGFVRSICDRVRAAPEGGKHFALRNAALSMGGIMAAAGLTEATATETLIHALPGTVKDWNNATKTIAWGIKFGSARPIEFEDRPFAKVVRMFAEPPPAQVNGFDDTDLASLAAALADGPGPDDEIEIEPPPGTPKEEGASLWVIEQAWKSVDIPRRPWIARGYLMRGSLTVVSGAGAAGKSSLMIAWAAALTIGCAFRHLKTPDKVRVATYNVEDDEHEQKRRFSAMFKRFALDETAFEDRLAILGPRGIGTLLTVSRDGSVVLNTGVMDDLEAFVARFMPDVLILDPFVELHGAEENDNTAVRAVLARFRDMAAKSNMSVVLLHHSRKGNGEPGDPDTLRGASSIVGAARVVLTLTVMSKDEAKAFKIADNSRRNYFRMDGAKSNYAPIDETEWFERQEITLDNAGAPEEPADRVAVAWPWEPPSIWEHDPSVLRSVLDVIDKGPSPGVLYSPSRRGKANDRWVGNVLIADLNLSDEQAKQMIKAWLDSGLLISALYHDHGQRKEVPGVRVDFSKTPSS
jgi:hypothetical protein